VIPAIRIFALWFAAWCQVMLVTAMPLSPVIAGGDAPVCHVDGGTGQNTPSQPVHHDHECVLCCLICHSVGWSSAILASPPSLPAPHSIAAATLIPVQPRAPPARLALSAQPRGPPALI
jgi:hypothetical protein